MAQCFDLVRSPSHHRYPHRRRTWPLWK
jgi:hypothetical protein